MLLKTNLKSELSVTPIIYIGLKQLVYKRWTIISL